MARQIDFWTLLRMTQEYVSSHYAAVLTDKAKLSQLKAYVDKYLARQRLQGGRHDHQGADR